MFQRLEKFIGVEMGVLSFESPSDHNDRSRWQGAGDFYVVYQGGEGEASRGNKDRVVGGTKYIPCLCSEDTDVWKEALRKGWREQSTHMPQRRIEGGRNQRNPLFWEFADQHSRTKLRANIINLCVL